jgi:hypothetical protein
VRELDVLVSKRGKPKLIVSDNGPELTSRVVLIWAAANGIEWHYIQPGKPQQNGYTESLNEHWFLTLAEARSILESWQQDYNHIRPHSAQLRNASRFRGYARGGLRQTRGGHSARPLRQPTIQSYKPERTLLRDGLKLGSRSSGLISGLKPAPDGRDLIVHGRHARCCPGYTPGFIALSIVMDIAFKGDAMAGNIDLDFSRGQ